MLTTNIFPVKENILRCFEELVRVSHGHAKTLVQVKVAWVHILTPACVFECILM